MDRPLEDMIVERQRGGARGRRNGRTDSFPREGVRKPSQRNNGKNLDSRDWVHDRYEDHDYRSANYREPASDRFRPDRDSRPASSAKLRVDNLHYDLTESDLRELFTRIGPIVTCQILYDRSDRSRGTAFVTYHHRNDALDAVREFDGANAYGQPITVVMQPTGPSRGGARGADRFEMPPSRPRSLFDRISEPAPRRRSVSPEDRRSDVTKPAPDYIDRYVPSQGARSRDRSPRPRGNAGRRPGARREDSGRRDRRRDDDGRPMVKGRPRKTAEELDAEMSDYWGSGQTADAPAARENVQNVAQPTAAEVAPAADGDIDMIE